MARRVEVHLVGDSRSLERAFDRAERKGRQFDSSMGKAGSSLKTFAKAGLAGAAAAGTALVTSQLIKSVAAAKEAELAEARLGQALASAGLSHKKYGKQLDAVIQKTSKLAALDDEELSDSFAKLVRTTGSVEKATKGMALAADIARARNISLEAATKAVERALAGNESAFSRLGIQSNKNKDATDELTEAQRRFGGAAERYGKTSVAANERLAIAWENVQEKLGKKMLPALVKVSEKLIQLIEWGERNWPRFAAFVSDAWAKIKPVFDAFKSYFSGWVQIISGIVEGDWSKVWGGIKKTVVAGFTLLYEYLKAVPARLFKFGLQMGKQLAGGVLEGLKGLPGKILDAVNPFEGGNDPGPGSRGTRAQGARGTRTPAKPAGTPKATYDGPRASGGSVRPGASYLVGERGPEILTMGGQRGFIAPNEALGGGGFGTVVLNVDGREFARVVIGHAQRIGKSGVAQQRGGSWTGQNLALG